MDTKHMYATMKPNPASVASAAPLSASPSPSAAPTMSVGALNMPPARMNAMLVQLLRSDSSMRRPSASAAAVVSRAALRAASCAAFRTVLRAASCAVLRAVGTDASSLVVFRFASVAQARARPRRSRFGRKTAPMTILERFRCIAACSQIA